MRVAWRLQARGCACAHPVEPWVGQDEDGQTVVLSVLELFEDPQVVRRDERLGRHLLLAGQDATALDEVDEVQEVDEWRVLDEGLE